MKAKYPPSPPEECDYCGGSVHKVSQEDFYGTDYGGGKLYVCDRCEARVGTHRGTDEPLGTLADHELRSLRKSVHDLFDPMWQDARTGRQEAYDYFFGELLGLPKHRRHVAMLNKEECRTAIRILKEQ